MADLLARLRAPVARGVRPRPRLRVRLRLPWRPAAGALPLALAGLLGGAGAAAIGLAAVLLPVFALWIFTPYLENGTESEMRVVAALWLLAHGVRLTRGGGMPVGVAPLLLTALTVVLLRRTAARTGGYLHLVPEDVSRRQAAVTAGASVGTGYLLVAGAAVATASSGPLRPSPLPALLHVAALAVPSVVAGLHAATGPWRLRGPAGRGRGRGPDGYGGEPGSDGWSWARTRRAVSVAARRGADAWRSGVGGRWHPALGAVSGPADGPGGWARRLWPGVLRVAAGAGCPGAVPVALRGAAAAVAALFGGGALALDAALVLHLGADGAIAAHLAPDLPGRCSLLLLCLLYVPNAAVWGAAYALGAGASFGPQPPAFPLLGALPDPGLLGAVVPVAAGLAGAAVVARASARSGPDAQEGRPWGAVATGLVALGAALGGGAALGVLARAAGGALGVHALAWVGPEPVRVAWHAAAWLAAVAVPGALLLRARVLGLRPGSGPAAEAVHALPPLPDDEFPPRPGLLGRCRSLSRRLTRVPRPAVLDEMDEMDGLDDAPPARAARAAWAALLAWRPPRRARGAAPDELETP